MGKINEILQSIVELGSRGYVISKQLFDLNDDKDLKEKIKTYKYVFVADNPGQKEKNNGDYLSSGNTKLNFDIFLSEHLKLERKDCLILNKSLFQTKSTKDLALQRDNDESQTLIAELILAILDINESCYIVLLGWTDYFKVDDGAIFHRFYTSIKKVESNYKKQNFFLAYPHPSRRQLLTKAELEKLKKSSIDEIEFFRYFGHKQFLFRKPNHLIDDFITEYQNEVK